MTVADGQLTTSRSFDVIVQAVNDAPSFVGGPSQTVLEDSGPQTVSGWAAALSAGPPDEAGADAGFCLTTDNDALFSQPPAVTADGRLTFTPAANANGQATVSVVLRDSGGTAGGGVEATPAHVFTIGVTPVNDAPKFTVGGNQSVAQDAGPQVVPGFVSILSPGAENESGQTVTFLVTSDRPALFAVPPVISAAGRLSYVPRPEASGSTTVTVRLRDNGGTANGGADTSATQTFTIAVTTFAEETGVYNGLALPAPEATPGAEKTGLLRFTLTKGGSFTARLRLGEASFGLRGSLDKAGLPRFLPGRSMTAVLARKKQPPLTLALHLDVSGGSDQLAGTITESGAPFATFHADRALYSRSPRPHPPLRSVPPTLLGQYTVLFTGGTAPGLTLAASPYPLGDGFGRLTVQANGTTRLVGRLADGSALSYANALSKENVLPLWIPFEHGKGALAGPAAFREIPGVSDLDGPDLRWFKPAKPRDTTYPAGWPGGIHLDLIGSAYALPPRGSSRCVLPGLAAPDAIGNAVILAANDPSEPPFLSKPVNLTAKNQVLVLGRSEDRVAHGHHARRPVGSAARSSTQRVEN